MTPTHYPKASLCIVCANKQRDCSGLMFDLMPPLRVDKDHMVAVRCTEFVRETSK